MTLRLMVDRVTLCFIHWSRMSLSLTDVSASIFALTTLATDS